MSYLSPLEEKIYNRGERLIPGVTHDLWEVVRHKSSYKFFRKVIEKDLLMADQFAASEAVTIADLGCGVGHGCFTLSKLEKARITGFDSSGECLEYAESHYKATNITYQLADLIAFIPEMPEYDYIVSRGVFEHLPDGIKLALSTKWRYRLLFDVPYNETAGVNPFHLLSGITEKDFSEFPEVELFFQDLAGVIYNPSQKPFRPNMIICICSHPELPKVNSGSIGFPVPSWQGETGF